MESASARRRIQQIACHLAAHKEGRGPLLLPMSCNGTTKSMIRRFDNMVFFARQGTSSQGYFMRQVTIKQYPDHGEVKASQLDATSECSRNVSAARGNKNFASNASQDPMFSKAVESQQGSAESLAIPQQSQQNMQSAAARSPLFAKPTLGSNKGNNTTPVSPVAGHLTGEHMNNFNEWSPRMDVAESGSDYVVTIELPGVSASTIRVEVNDERLLVTGQRSTEWWRDGNEKYAVYHKRELSEGPYRVVWHLPSNSNKDAVSAEFVDGFLQIRILKQDQ